MQQSINSNLLLIQKKLPFPLDLIKYGTPAENFHRCSKMLNRRQLTFLISRPCHVMRRRPLAASGPGQVWQNLWGQWGFVSTYCCWQIQDTIDTTSWEFSRTGAKRRNVDLANYQLVGWVWHFIDSEDIITKFRSLESIRKSLMWYHAYKYGHFWLFSSKQS